MNRFHFAFEIFLCLISCKCNLENWTQYAAAKSMTDLKRCNVTNGRKDKVGKISICYLLANLMICKNKQLVKSSIKCIKPLLINRDTLWFEANFYHC